MTTAPQFEAATLPVRPGEEPWTSAELAEVRQTLEEEATSQPKAKARRVKWPDVEVRAKRIFGESVLPNLVLLEREEAPY